MLRRLSSAAGGLARRLSAPPHLPLSSSRHPTIVAVPREQSHIAATAIDLANGRIPTVLFSRTRTPNPQLLTTDRRQILKILARTPFLFTTKFTLEVRPGEGSGFVLSSSTVIPYKVHKDDKGRVISLEMARVEDGLAVRVSLPIVYKGEDVCPGLKKGGRLEKMRPALSYLCPTEHMPQMLEVDLTNLDIKSKVLIDDLKVHPSLKLMDSGGHNVPICKIWGPPPKSKPICKIWGPPKSKPVREATEETPKLVPEATEEAMA